MLDIALPEFIISPLDFILLLSSSCRFFYFDTPKFFFHCIKFPSSLEILFLHMLKLLQCFSEFSDMLILHGNV
jgi:hypothetical protein